MTLAHPSFPASKRTAALGGPTPAVEALLRLVLRPYRRLLLRQQLEALSERLLADIGLERDDLPAVIRTA